MPKTRFVLAAALVAAVRAPAAHADGQASPGVYQGWNGLVDKDRGARFVALPADRGRWTVLARIKLRGGSVTRYGSIRGSYGIPGVTFRATSAVFRRTAGCSWLPRRPPEARSFAPSAASLLSMQGRSRLARE